MWKPKKYFHLATSAHVCENQIFIFQLDFCAEFIVDWWTTNSWIRNLVERHVTLFTSNDKFEERGFTIITFQDSQAEISEFTSKLCNPALVILNCNNNFTTFSSWYTGQKHLRSAKHHPPQILYLLYYLGEFYTLVPIEIIHLNPYWMPPNQVLPSRLSTFWCTIVN